MSASIDTAPVDTAPSSTFVLEPEFPRTFSTFGDDTPIVVEVGQPRLPHTGATSLPVVGSASLALVLGVAAVVASRVRPRRATTAQRGVS